MNISAFKKKAEDLGFCCLENELMCNYTSFSVGGPAELLVMVNNCDVLPSLIKTAEEMEIPITVIGKGSNLLVSDSGIEGAVLRICDERINVSKNKILAYAGAKLSKLCITARDNCLSGLEFAWGIPGSVGGAVYMNAGAYGGEMKQVINSCRSIDCSGNFITRNADELELGYRTSVYKNTDEIIISAEVELKSSNAEQIKSQMDDYLNRRKSKQPLEYPSAGSTFKRPEGNFAGTLIEQCGLKGYRIGGAEVSEKHAGFVINKGGATCDDILKLVEHIKDTVYKKTGVHLEPEVIFKGIL